MTQEQQNAIILMLANDAVGAADENYPTAALLLFDAGISLLVTRLIGAADRREMGAMFSEYVTTQVEAVIANGGAA